MSYLNTGITKRAGDDDYDFVRQNVAPSVAGLGLAVPQYVIAKKVHALGPTAGENAENALKGMEAIWKKMGLERVKDHWSEEMFGPNFNSRSNTLNVTKDNLGILAHETGHAKNHASIKKLFGKPGVLAKHIMSGAGKFGSMLGSVGGSLAALFGAEDDTVRNIGIAGSAAALPQFAEEIVASARGANMLRKLKAPMKSRLGAFVGLPAHLLAVAAPMTPWLGLKAYDKLKED